MPVSEGEDACMVTHCVKWFSLVLIREVYVLRYLLKKVN